MAPNINKPIPETIDNSLDYEPHDFGNGEKPLQHCGALVHLIKYIIGAGILAIPYAFRNVGYIIGIFGTLIAGLLQTHIIHILLSVEYELCKRLRTPNLTYVGVIESSFIGGSKRARYARHYCIFLTYFNYVFNSILTNAGYLLIMAGNLKDIYDDHYHTNSDIKYFITALIIPLTILCWIPRLKFLVPFSALTCIFTLLNIIIIITIPVPPTSEVGQPKLVNNIFFFPQFFGLLLLTLSATAMVLPIKNDMEKPKSFSSDIGVLNSSIFISTVVYAMFGLLCYLKYGDSVQGNVLSNLPRGQVLSILVYILYTAALCISFTLSFYVIYDTVWSNYLSEKILLNRWEQLCNYGLKTLINIFIYITATAIPSFELLFILMGTLCILTDICIPPILHIILLLSRTEMTSKMVAQIFKDFVIIIIGFSLFLSGFINSVLDLIQFYCSSH